MHLPAKSSQILPLAGRMSSEGAWEAGYVFVSWLHWRSGPDELGNCASVLLPDVLWRELKVDHRGLDLCMTHELHERRKANACPEHVRSEGVPKSVRVCLRHARGLPMMTK